MKLMILSEQKDLAEMKQSTRPLFDTSKNNEVEEDGASNTTTTIAPQDLPNIASSHESNNTDLGYTKAQEAAINLYVGQGITNNVKLAEMISLPLPTVLKIRRGLGI